MYSISLALLGGQGYQYIDFPKVPEAVPLSEFMLMHRDYVSPDDFQACFSTPNARPFHVPIGGPEYSRVFDMYTTALLWKMFGISWRVYFIAYTLVSTMACLLICLIGRRLGGSFWPGFFAALLFLASPLENDFASLAIRDINPLWFAILAFFILVCVADSFRTFGLNCASFVGLGVVTNVGFGWRPDSLVLNPFMLIGLLGCLWYKGRGWRYIVVSVLLFGSGAVGPHLLISSLVGNKRLATQNGFHVAYYGEGARCNLLGLEHSFQITFDDVHTVLNAMTYYENRNPSAPPLECLSSQYAETCRSMWLELMEYNAYRYVSQLPRLYYLAIQSSAAKTMPVTEWSRDTVDASHHVGRPDTPFPHPNVIEGYPALVNYLGSISPVLYLFSVVPVFLFCRQRFLTGMLLLFSLYYAGVLIAVLPQFKHSGMLLLPVTVVGGMGIVTFLRLVNPMEVRRTFTSFSWHRAVIVLILLAGGCLLWLITCKVAYACSLGKRTGYLREIVRLAQTGTPISEAIKSPRVFSTVTAKAGEKWGYLLQIKAGPEPGRLLCKHLHYYDPLPSEVDLIYRTSHQLHSNQIQYFFVSSMAPSTNWPVPKVRHHLCKITLEGDAQIVSALRLDLSHWTKLTTSTVFVTGECTPGSPWVCDDPSGESMMGYTINTLPDACKPRWIVESLEELASGGLRQE
ncbi:hypothetical protein AYO40_05010 [Planctomycetaceae bacterium SCGC AG-212-D15]|nr:hypothetical protein AYO40_05010 [Planctomycetaceae bacterium SCGC AG-212-D15]